MFALNKNVWTSYNFPCDFHGGLLLKISGIDEYNQHSIMCTMYYMLYLYLEGLLKSYSYDEFFDLKDV